MIEGRMPKIVVEPPGPASNNLRKMDEEYVYGCLWLGGKQLPIAISEGEGALVKDVDGNQYLDFTSGLAVCNVGHRHPKVIEAAKKQMDKLVHISQHIAIYEPYTKLAEKMAEIAPSGLVRSFFCNGGGEAMEGAVKVARFATEKAVLLAFTGAFHGQTTGMMNLSASVSEWKYGFQLPYPGIIHVPFGNCYRCALHQEYPGCDIACLDFIEHVLDHVVFPEEVAGVVFEPIQGEKGVIIPPEGFPQKLEKICRSHDMLMITDEVQTGFGRTGKMFAAEHWNLHPDIMAFAKGIAGGFPLGGFITRDDLTRLSITHGSTFGGNPVSCAAALATIDVLIKEKLPERASKLGVNALKRLVEMKEHYESIGDVRGKGLLMAMEIVKDKKTREPDTETAEDIREIAMKRGVLLTGQFGKQTLRLIPPLTIGEDQLETGLDTVEDAVKLAESKR